MIEYIAPFLKDMDARALPSYQNFINIQSKFIKDRFDRLYRSQGHESNGVKLLRYILQFIDYDYLDRQDNNYDRYLHHLRYIKHNVDNIFDRVSRGRGYPNLFIANESPTAEEFILPIEDLNTLVNLPLWSSSWNDWRRVRCLYLWDHNSTEFTTNLLNDRLTFAKEVPTHALFLLDIVALTMKYYIWGKEQRFKEPEEELALKIPQQLFLHKYVMCDLVWDNAYIWLINQLNAMIQLTPEEFMNQYSNKTLQTESQWGYISTNCFQGFESLHRLIYDTSKNISPESVLSSKLIFGSTINQRVRISDKYLTLPMQRQYDYLRWMRDRKLLSLIVKLYSLRPDLPTTKNIKFNLKRDFKRVLMNRPWNTCNSVSLKYEIQNEIFDFIKLLN